MSDVRDALVAYANSIEGLTAPSPEYAALVAEWEVQHDDDADAANIMQASDCALVGWAILEGAGIALPARGKYIFGKAVTNIVNMAQAAGAYVLRPVVITPGDVLHFSASDFAPEHIGTVVAEGERIDGGHRTDAKLETIVRVRRALTKGRSGYFMEAGTNRLVAAAIDPDRLLAAFGLAA